ncbi:MAG: hypothetical protein LBC88_00775 [Spirochaetaceae bacterium]|jgi:hypothetical protein|nr:hypothetical protein [Spirochaetaceae bacterium]
MKSYFVPYTLFFAAALLSAACAGGDAAVLPYQADIRVADIPAVHLGELNVGTLRPFGKKVEFTPVSLTYHPRTDAIALEMRQGVLYRQYWTRRMREAFMDALETYEADYAARNLPGGSQNRTSRAYRSMTGKIEWRMSGITREYQGFPVMELGYRFESGSPYFTVTQRIARDEREPDTSRQVSSGRMVFYFTRAMAKELAAFFDDEYLDRLVPEAELNTPPAVRTFPAEPY